MEPSEDSGSGLDIVGVPTEEPPFRLRSYQAEMVEQSMRENIICVMDTGSGKTHIAIERTRIELETCPPDKLVWFLAPTVTLCEQQYDVFKMNLPGYGIQLLCGKDGVDHWTEQAVWDAVLQNVRIVLSTHKVLHDALGHAFVKMRKLALLIFDEAHHCTLKHPAHRIMEEFYQSDDSSNPLPKILGLSASPVMKAKATEQGLQEIESNLHAIAKTPNMHRSELLRYVHKPELLQLYYKVISPARSHLLLALEHAHVNYNIAEDPYVKDLVNNQQSGRDTLKQLEKTYINGKTYCNEQLRTLVSKAKDMAQELGTSAAEWYLHQCMTQYEKSVRVSDQQLLGWSVDEKRHLLKILRQLPFSDIKPSNETILDTLSPKVEVLINTLVTQAQDNPDFTGLVFVEQRVWVATLAEILSLDPRTKDLLRVGTFVGTSQSIKRKTNVSSFAEPKNQKTTLDDFRAGSTNVILATSVLEEGIDVSSCHLVICFESPKNLKSFVQRRGRARKKQSKYFIFTPEVGARSSESWNSLEAEMRAAYENDMRQVQEAEERKQEEEVCTRVLLVPSTGARLTIDDVLPHLNHFCALAAAGPYVDTRPQFEFFKSTSGRITAEVQLPTSIDVNLRISKSKDSWITERMAQKDAAFEAYAALYSAGLVNNNLLPARRKEDDLAAQFQIPDHRPSMVEISPLFDPWPQIAQYQQDNPNVWYRVLLKVRATGEDTINMLLLTPVLLPIIPEIVLHWNQNKKYKVESSWLSSTSLADEEIHTIRSITRKILQSIYGNKMQGKRDDFPWLMLPCDDEGTTMSYAALSEWNDLVGDQRTFSTLPTLQHLDASDWGLVSREGDMRKYMLNTLCSELEEPTVLVTRVPKRRDFLHKDIGDLSGSETHSKLECIAISECIVESIPTKLAVFALLFPSILHRFEIGIIGEILRTTLLKPVAFDASHLPIIIRALTSSSVASEEDYQRLEFLGDCILKFIASAHLMADHLTWPESFLTGKKGKLVSNGFLARATLAAGLDKFVRTKQFTGAKWKPTYVGDLLADATPPIKIERSSKLIADVIESLVGASYVAGGFDKAFVCVQSLLPQEPWIPPHQASDTLFDAAAADTVVTNLGILEILIGHTFIKRQLLVEALTHASYTGPNAHCSYQRLEFLGDAILDQIVSTRVYNHESELLPRQMHAIRTAMVNASFLAFTMLETTVSEETTNKETWEPEVQERALWQFLRSGNHELLVARDAAIRQHQQARDQISAALGRDARYPWHLLALPDAPKFLSDIVESVIGAIYVDTRGNIAACEVFVRRLGIIGYLERILRDGVDCLHPKERLGMLANEKKVKYVQVVSGGDGDGSEIQPRIYKCQVKLGGVDVGGVAHAQNFYDVGGVVEGPRQLNAETIAAWKAIGILERSGSMEVDGIEHDEEEVFFDAEEGGGVTVEDW